MDGFWNPTSQLVVDGSWRIQSGKIQLMGTINQRTRESTLHSELEALSCAMENMLCHSLPTRFWTILKKLLTMIGKRVVWPNFSTELKEIAVLQRIFHHFKLIYILRSHNVIVIFLAIGNCSFLVSIPV